jgi:hypothetical protein
MQNGVWLSEVIDRSIHAFAKVETCLLQGVQGTK